MHNKDYFFRKCILGRTVNDTLERLRVTYSSQASTDFRQIRTHCLDSELYI